MKLIIIIAVMLSSISSYCTTYYISNTGSDVANGTSEGTAWQTISKINSSSFLPGDFILFKKGDSWNERLNPPSSGSEGNVITFGSYGSGATPVITGFQTLSGWSNVGNIWSSIFSNSVNYQNTVYINGALRAKGRYPNNSYLTFTSHSGTSQITGALTGTPNYTGGEVVIRERMWAVDHYYITSQSGGSINYTVDPRTGFGQYYEPINGYGYFIQNIESVLDTLNEWCYDTTSKIIKVYATSQPTLKASTLDVLLQVSNKNYLTFTDILFEGSNYYAIKIDTCNYITFTGCDISNSGGDGISVFKTTFLSVLSSTFTDTWNNAISVIDPEYFGKSNDCTITGNTIENTGLEPGMDKNRFNTNVGIIVVGDRLNILNNTVINSGYIPIVFYSAGGVVKNNLIHDFCSVLDDGGGIYTSGALSSINNIIRGNIVYNGIGNHTGTTKVTDETVGIYLDQGAVNNTVDSNTIYNTVVGIYLHITHVNTVRENTMFNNVITQFHIEISDNNSIQFKKNIMGGANTRSTASVRYFPYFSSCDSNYYLNTADTNKIWATTLINSGTSLTAWQNSYSLDLNSNRTPTGITAATPILITNPTFSDSTVSLGGSYISATGEQIYNAVVLKPFTSKILFTSSTSFAPRNTFSIGGLIFSTQ